MTTVINIINDCSFVLESLIPFLDKDFKVNFVTRDRGLYNKTFGLAHKIYSCKNGLFHVNYALQDAFIVSKLKRLDILHCHGSDIRNTLKSKKYGWIVRSNLKRAGKVLFSTPDLCGPLEDLVDNPVYLPNPVNTQVFQPKENNHKRPRALYFIKKYEKLPPVVKVACHNYNIDLKVIPLWFRIPFKDMPRFLCKFDLFIDRFSINSFSKTCLESMACGLATVPIYKEKVYDSLGRFSTVKDCRKEGKRNRAYILYHHEASKIADRLKKIWNNIK